MRIETQFSVFLVNKPGVLAQVLNELAKSKINITAITMMDSVEHGVLRLVAGRAKPTREILQKLNVSISETEVLCLNLPNQSGALADVCTRLGRAHVNINYAYCTAGARGGRTTGILKVADLKKAMKVLEKYQSTSSSAAKKKAKMRPSQSRRIK